MGVVMKATLRYQNGCLYVDHGAWYVKYRQRIAQEDGSSKLNRASKFLGRIKVFDRTVLEAVEKVQMRIEELRRAKGGHQQLQLKFGDGLDLPVTLVAESPRGSGFPHFSAVRSAVGQQSIAGPVVSC
jgi:hypothetical protein